MFGLDGKQQKEQEEMFEQWTKILQKDLPSFWDDFKEDQKNKDESDSYSKSLPNVSVRRRSGI